MSPRNLSNNDCITLVENYFNIIDSSTGINEAGSRFVTQPETVDKIMEFFSEDAVYSRQTQGEPFKGKPNIDEFFLRKRRLAGDHLDIRMSVSDGVPSYLSFEPKSAAHYATVTVTGKFRGANVVTIPPSSGVRGSFVDKANTEQNVELNFTDYWVIDKSLGKAVFRHSDIQPVRTKNIEGGGRY